LLLTCTDSEFIIRVKIIGDLGDSHRTLVECALLLLQNMAEYMAGHEVSNGRITTDYSTPPYAHRYVEYLHSAVEFDFKQIEC